MFPRPTLPPPIEEMFGTREEFLRARNNYLKQKQEVDESIKTELAIVIVVSALLTTLAIAAFSSLLYLSFGWKGPVAMIAFVGLFWAAVSRVKQYL